MKPWEESYVKERGPLDLWGVILCRKTEGKRNQEKGSDGEKNRAPSEIFLLFSWPFRTFFKINNPVERFFSYN